MSLITQCSIFYSDAAPSDNDKVEAAGRASAGNARWAESARRASHRVADREARQASDVGLCGEQILHLEQACVGRPRIAVIGRKRRRKRARRGMKVI